MSELKPLLRCPFCGSQDIFLDNDAWEDHSALNTKIVNRYTLNCYDCGISTDSFDTKENVIRFWNKRANNE